MNLISKEVLLWVWSESGLGRQLWFIVMRVQYEASLNAVGDHSHGYVLALITSVILLLDRSP